MIKTMSTMLAVINIASLAPLYSPSFVVQDYLTDASPAALAD
jgi:hypothetical protein